jgi:N-acetylated-alpha-linked acidic dipeptidase
VYCNYGSKADYKRMYDSGIDIKGSIALVKYYGDQGDRALKVKAAEEWGVKGVLIYSDPADDGFLRGQPWPEGRWRPADGVQRGTVGLSSWIAGDVLTPGWPSTEDANRISKDDNPGLVNIPSLPLSWRDAQKLLQSLKGHGQELPDEWHGGVPDVEWWSGDQTSPVVNLKNEQDEIEKQPIYNLVGSIEGIETSQKKVIVGNHRDSWCFGSGDPGSGTAVMLEVIDIFKHLRMQGWRPLRTIEFISWDAEEYNLIGSTEHVENYMDELRRDGVAYLNVDVGVVGQNFWAAASPLFKDALYRVLGRINDPVRNDTLLNLWKNDHTQIQALNAGSDYLSFQTMSGTSSIDFGFGSLQDESYPYHSCYETFEWMMKFGDPGLQYHQLLAQVWVLLIIELSGEMILRLDVNEYANAVASYIDDLQKYSETKGAPWADEKGNGGFKLDDLWESSKLLIEKATHFSNWESWWDMEFYGRGGLETNALALQRILHNEKASDFETNLLDIPDSETQHHGVGGFFTALIHSGLGTSHNKTDSQGGDGNGEGEVEVQHSTAGENGIKGREQFKHVVLGPRKWQGYEGDTFPHVRDAIEDQDWIGAQERVDAAAKVIKRAAERLVH